jgi:arylsulfatase A-like enzyme
LVASALLLGGLCAAQAGKPRIVFVLVDDLGWTDLSTGRTSKGNGSDYYRTPNIDALAARGMSFDNAYACGPNCAPTRAALLTGLHPARTGVYTVLSWPPARNRRLDPAPNRSFLLHSAWTIAETVRTVGYATGHFGKWHLGDDPDIGPRAQGFDHNAGGTGFGTVSGGSSGHFARSDGSWDLPGLPANGMPYQFIAERLTDEAIAWMDANKHRPFLCWLSHFSVHTPIQAPAADVAAFDGVPPGHFHHDQVYAGMLKNLDDNVGRVVRFLEETEDPARPGSKLIDNTVVVFTSDNGGVGGYASAGVVGARDITHQFPLRSGKGSLYEGGIRVPLIVRWDGRVPAGALNSSPVQSIDFHPTLARMAGALLSDEPQFDGVDLGPVLRGSTVDLARAGSFWHFPAYASASPILGTWIETPASAVRRGQWKLRFAYETRAWELYDLANDPGESIDRAGERPDLVRVLGNELRAWLIATAAELPRERSSGIPVPLPGAPGAGDAVDWELRANAPAAVSEAAAAAIAAGVLVFGGRTDAGASDALWRFAGGQWQMLAAAGRPPAWRAHAGCSWSKPAGMLVFGGADASDALLDDTWIFDGQGWSPHAGNGPQARSDAALAFDPRRGVAILFGGRDAGGVRDDTWVFDGSDWRALAIQDPPPARAAHGLVHDADSGRTFLFGGSDGSGALLADTWVFDGVRWRALPGASPPARASFAFAWDALRARAVLFGGRDADGLALADTWEFDGAVWRERTPANPALAVADAVAAFDGARGRTVVCGGRNGARYAATWDYGASAAAELRAFGRGCPGSAGEPQLVARALPWLGATMTAELAPLPGPAALMVGFSDRAWAGGPLPWSLAVLGAPDCWLLVSPETVLPLAVVAGAARAQLAVPDDAGLLGLPFFAQGLAADPPAAALVVSDALAGRIGAR